MNKKFSLLFVLVFLCVQTLSLVHMAEHGFANHKHNGKVCDVAAFCEQAKIATADAPVLLPPADFYIIKNAPANSIGSVSAEYSISNPRAPPASILL